jgi:type IV pilus assembly protein PilB
MVHPRDLTALGELRRVLEPTQVEPVALSADDFATALVRYRIGARGETTGAELRPESLVFDAADAERESDKAARVVGDEVVRLVNRIVAAALSREASDVHVEPEVTGVRVRFRVHGALQDWNETVAPSFARGVVARFKVLSGLDITERRLPQDGRIGLTAGGRELDLRVSTLPSSRGEKVVLRVFEGAGLLRPLDQLFLEPGTLAGVRRALQRPYGTVLIAGGTGSGKSSTLYALLLERRRARPDTNMLMIEDPIEYRLQGITQVQVNAAAGLGFAQVLRAALRQDPDVLAVGETRDAETAHLALEAGMTGHLLLTLLHANHVGGVLQRLESLGCSRTLVGESASFILAQRLVRKLCPLCMKMEPSAPAMVESLVARRLLEKGANVPLPRAAGCEACHHAGFNGRVAITEALAVTDEVRDAIVGGQAAVEVERIAHAQGAFVSFGQCAAQLLARRIIGPGEALLAAAD